MVWGRNVPDSSLLPYHTLPHSTPFYPPSFPSPCPPVYRTIPCPTPFHYILPSPVLPFTVPYHAPTPVHSTLPSLYPTPLHYTLPYLSTLSPLRITLPYPAPCHPLLHSTHVTPLPFTLPYPPSPLQLHSSLPSPLTFPAYHALTLPNSPLPYNTLPHSTPFYPFPSPSHVLLFTVPYPALLHSTIFSPPMSSHLPYHTMPLLHSTLPSSPLLSLSYPALLHSTLPSPPLYPTLPYFTSLNSVRSYRHPRAGRDSSIGSVSAWHASDPEFDPHVRHILSWRLGYETISTAILLLPLIQEEQLSVTGERMWTKYW